MVQLLADKFIGPVNEDSTPTITGTFLDEDTNQGIPQSSFSTISMTLYDAEGPDYDIVNSRDGFDLLTYGGFSVDANGIFKLELEVGDTVILNTDLELEKRHVLLEWTWVKNARTLADNYTLEIHIKNKRKIP